MDLKYQIYEEIYLVRRYPDEIDKSSIIYNTKEDAELQLEINLNKRDFSSDVEMVKKIEGNVRSFTNVKQKSKIYSFNVIKQKHKLQGFVINLGVVVWNKETEEISYKFIDKDKMKDLLNLMPKMHFIEDIIESVERNFKKCDVSELRKYIVNYSMGSYPLTHSFEYEFCNSCGSYGDNTDISIVVDRLYNDFIGCHFE